MGALWHSFHVAADTLYDLLGVAQDATTEEIRAAYRRLSKTYHPDAGGTPAFFRQLQIAYDTLTDPERRAEYDRSLRVSAAPPPRPKIHGPLRRDNRTTNIGSLGISTTVGAKHRVRRRGTDTTMGHPPIDDSLLLGHAGSTGLLR
jgi:curved DNA-binding protein CbpA